MTIGDLIRELQRHPLGMEVYIDSENGDRPIEAVVREQFDGHGPIIARITHK